MYELVPVFGMITFWGAIVAIVLVPRYFRSRERQEMQATLRAAIDKGQPLPAEVIDALSQDSRPPRSGGRDLRIGVIWTAVAAGFIGLAYALGYMSEESAHAFWPLIGVSAFPAFMGVAFLLIALLGRDKDRA